MINCWIINYWTINCWIINCWTINGWIINSWTINGWMTNCWIINCWMINCWIINCWIINGWMTNCWIINGWMTNYWVINCWIINCWMINCWILNGWMTNCWIINCWMTDCWIINCWIMHCEGCGMKQQCQNRGISRDMSHRCGALGDPLCTNLIMYAIAGDRGRQPWRRICCTIAAFVCSDWGWPRDTSVRTGGSPAQTRSRHLPNANPKCCLLGPFAGEGTRSGGRWGCW